MKTRGLTSFDLKIIALVAMTIDHIGFFIFPDEIIYRIIGRLAFVIFAFFIGNSYIYTRNRETFALKLVIYAIILELILQLSNASSSSSIFLTLTLGYLLIYSFDNKKILLALIVLLIPTIYVVDYGYYGILIIFFSYVFHTKKYYLIIVNIIFCYVFYIVNELSFIQFYSVIGSILLLLYNEQEGRKMKNFFYLYYPIHILVLYSISLLIIK